MAHFRALASTLKYMVTSIERFRESYKTFGVPATAEHRVAAAMSSATSAAAMSSTTSAAAMSSTISAAAVAKFVQNFVTAMDWLKLNMVAVDQVHPLLLDLSASLKKLTFLPCPFEGKTKVKDWIARVSEMGAADG